MMQHWQCQLSLLQWQISGLAFVMNQWSKWLTHLQHSLSESLQNWLLSLSNEKQLRQTTTLCEKQLKLKSSVKRMGWFFFFCLFKILMKLSVFIYLLLLFLWQKVSHKQRIIILPRQKLNLIPFFQSQIYLNYQSNNEFCKTMIVIRKKKCYL